MVNFDINSVRPLIEKALEEDIGSGDITTKSILTGREKGRAKAIAKKNLVVSGIHIFREVFLTMDNTLTVKTEVEDGQEVFSDTVLAYVEGKLASILTAERTALNFLQRMSGIATLTRQFCLAVVGTNAKILDTRKTNPGLRILDKYAVRCGGGMNHRFALYDGVLIKDNHITAAGGISEAIKRTRAAVHSDIKIEVEVKNTEELVEAIEAGADIVMLDNMTVPEMREAVRITRGRVLLEASGNVSLENVRDIAMTGVDFISVGALTHSVKAADISLKIVP
ncbi:MAG: carboxylating nicotinate-nucleotide diphosphorylase [Syntrophales bacterium]|nr:carboxylating nicotinate-nucleotide diphosphorylase [Syntrophales bacterium]